MSLFSSYDIAEVVIAEASDKFGKTISEDSKKRLKNECSLVDTLVSEYDCDAAEFSVNEETTDFEITLICPDMTIENDSCESFINAISDLSEVSFSASGDNLQANLIMRGLWRNTD